MRIGLRVEILKYIYIEDRIIGFVKEKKKRAKKRDVVYRIDSFFSDDDDVGEEEEDLAVAETS
jgi:hypothetical protein